MIVLRYLLIIIFLFQYKAFALIEVDITRGNLSPLPIAVSPICVCTAYAKSIGVASLGNFITDPLGVKQKTFSWNI